MALKSWGLLAVSRAPIPGHPLAHEAPLMGGRVANAGIQKSLCSSPGGSWRLAYPASSFGLVTTLPCRHWEGDKSGSIQGQREGWVEVRGQQTR